MLQVKLFNSTDLIKYLDYDTSLLRKIPFMENERFESGLLYLVAFEDTIPIGLRKFKKKDKSEYNNFLRERELPVITGNLYESWVVSVLPEMQRRGIGNRLNDEMLKLLDKGDLFIYGSHEEDGAKLNKSWLLSKDVNWFYMGNMLSLKEYDENQINFAVPSKDRHMFSFKKRAKRHIYYHGTSGTRLRAILKAGLIPAGYKGLKTQFKDDGSLRDSSPYGGVYIAPALKVAWEYASKSLKDRHRDSRVIVMMTVETRTPDVRLDEDSINDLLDDIVAIAQLESFPYLMTYLGKRVGKKIPPIYVEDTDWNDVSDTDIEKTKIFISNMMRLIEKCDVSSIAKKLTQQLDTLYPDITVDITDESIQIHVDTYIRTSLMSFLSRGAKEYWKDTVPDIVASIPDVEAILRSSVDTLTKALNGIDSHGRATLKNDAVGYPDNIRYPTVMGYRGKNRILAIVSSRLIEGVAVYVVAYGGMEGLTLAKRIRSVYYNGVPHYMIYGRHGDVIEDGLPIDTDTLRESILESLSLHGQIG